MGGGGVGRRLSYGEVPECQAEKPGVKFLGKMRPLSFCEQRRLLLAELDAGCGSTVCEAQ